MADTVKPLRCLNLRVCFGEYAKLFDFGFRQDHFRTALQMAVATGIASIFVFSPQVFSAMEGVPFFVFIIMSIILEPILGENLKKAVMTAVGGIVGGGLGMAATASTETATSKTMDGLGGATWRIFMAFWLIVGLSLMTLMKQRFIKYKDAFTICMIAFTLCSFLPESSLVGVLQIADTVIPPATHLNGKRFLFKMFICVAVLVAVIIVALVTSLVMPFTAGFAIKRKSEHLLEHLGDLSFNILGEFTQDPDEDMCIPGQTHTDKELRFVDDGLEKKYAPIMLRLQGCWDEIWQATELLPAAKAEKSWWVWGLRRADNARFPVNSYGFIFKCATKILTTQLNLMSNLDNGSVRLAVCKRHKGLLQDVQYDIASCFTSLAGLIHKSVDEEYVCERFRAMADSLVELYHGANANTRGYYDTDLETFAIFTKSAINLARQTALIFRELSPVIGLGMHNYIAASFAQTMDNYTYEGEPIKSREGSLAQMEKMPVRPPTVADMFKHPEDHRLAQVMLERVESFHAEDNPFEAENGSGQWQLQSNWSVHAMPNRDLVVNTGLPNDVQHPSGYQSCSTSLQSGPLGATTPSMSYGSSLASQNYRKMPSNPKMELMSRVTERADEAGSAEGPEQAQTPQSHNGRHSADVRLEVASMRRMSAEYENSMDKWDEITMRRALLGKLLTRRGTDAVAAYKATQIISDPQSVPADDMGWDEPIEQRKKRLTAEQQAALRASRELRASADLGSSSACVQAAWDHKYVLRSLGLNTRETTPYGTPSNYSPMGSGPAPDEQGESIQQRRAFGQQASLKKQGSVGRQRSIALEGVVLADAALSLARDRKGSLARGQLSHLLQPTTSLKKHASPAKTGPGLDRQRLNKRFKSKPDGSAVGEYDSAGTEGPKGTQQPNQSGAEQGPPADNAEPDSGAPPGRKLQKSRSFTEYMQMWRNPEDGEPTEPSPAMGPSGKAHPAKPLQVRLGNGHGAFRPGSLLSFIADDESDPATDFDRNVMAAALELQLTKPRKMEEDPRRSHSWNQLQEVPVGQLMVPADSLGIRNADNDFVPPASEDDEHISDDYFGAAPSLESAHERSLGHGDSPAPPRRKSLGGARPGLWQSSGLFAPTAVAPAAAVNPHGKTIIPPSAFASVAPLPSEQHPTGESRAARQQSLSRTWNQSLDRRAPSGIRQHSVGSRQGSAAGSLSRADPRFNALRELAKTQGGRLSEWKSEESNSNLRAWLRSPYAQQMKKSASAVERATRTSVDVRKIHTGPYEEDLHPELSKQPNGAEWHHASSNTGPGSTQSLHMQEKHMSYPRINKEVWNLDEEQPDAAFAGTQANRYRDSFDIEEGPNLDFYTFDEAHAAKPWEAAPSRKMRLVEESMERAKQSVIGAARSFWEARVMGRS